MNSLLKALPLILLLAGAALGQGTAFDCAGSAFTWTASTSTTVVNTSNATPCRSWAITFSSTSTLNSTLTFSTSPDNVTFTNVPNSQCTGATQQNCWIDGANPIPGTSNGTASFVTYAAYVRVSIVVNSGSGTGTLKIYGYKGLSAKTPGGGGGGSGPTTNQNVREVAFAYSGGGLAIVVTSPISWCREVTAAGTITGIYIEGDLSGNATVDIRTQSHASAISTGPSTASSIMGPSVPTFSGTFGYTDETLTGVTTTLAAKTSVCTFLTGSGTLTSLSVVVAYAAN